MSCTERVFFKDVWVTCMLICDDVVFICSFAVYELYLNVMDFGRGEFEGYWRGTAI